MVKLTVQEPLRDRVGRAIYECEEERGNTDRPDWYSLSEERREPWRKDADRAIEVINADRANDGRIPRK